MSCGEQKINTCGRTILISPNAKKTIQNLWPTRDTFCPDVSRIHTCSTSTSKALLKLRLSLPQLLELFLTSLLLEHSIPSVTLESSVESSITFCLAQGPGWSYSHSSEGLSLLGTPQHLSQPPGTDDHAAGRDSPRLFWTPDFHTGFPNYSAEVSWVATLSV